MYQRLCLLAWTAVFVPGVANAQIESLVTQKDIPACRTIEDGKLFAQAVETRQLDTFRSLLDSGRCIIWEKGTKIHLDQSVEGCGLTRIRGICEAVYAYADKNDPQVFIAPLDEKWTRRQLPAPSTENLRVMHAKLQQPPERMDAVAPLPRPRPKHKAKDRWFGQTFAARLAKLFRPGPARTGGRERSAYSLPQ